MFTPAVPSGGTIQAWHPMKSKGVDPYVSKTTYYLTSDINREHNFWAAKHLIECKVPWEMVDVYLGIIFFVRGNLDNKEDKRQISTLLLKKLVIFKGVTRIQPSTKHDSLIKIILCSSLQYFRLWYGVQEEINVVSAYSLLYF